MLRAPTQANTICVVVAFSSHPRVGSAVTDEMSLFEIWRPRVFGPGLALERRQHARLRERGLADARIAEQDREPVARRCEHIENFNCFALPAEEEQRVELGIVEQRPQAKSSFA